MTIQKIFFGTVLSILAFCPSFARATVITFDELPASSPSSFFPVPNGYQGLDWFNFGYLDGLTNSSPGSGYVNGLISRPHVAYNSFADEARASSVSPFSVQSGYFAAAWRTGLTVTVDGFLNGNLVTTHSFVVDHTAPTLINFTNFEGLNELRFRSAGGFDNPSLAGSGAHFALDNLTINGGLNAIPEPSSLTLWCVGTLWFATKRRRR
jgi:hypothetical protein